MTLDDGSPLPAFTIGYGGRAPGDLLRILIDEGVQLIVDVRQDPSRAAMGSYVRARDPARGIVGLLRSAGIDYVWLGEALGNPWRDEHAFPDWRQRYADLLAYEPTRLAGLRDLATPFALLCAEKDPARCHRTQIADALSADGFTIRDL